MKNDMPKQKKLYMEQEIINEIELMLDNSVSSIDNNKTVEGGEKTVPFSPFSIH